MTIEEAKNLEPGDIFYHKNTGEAWKVIDHNEKLFSIYSYTTYSKENRFHYYQSVKDISWTFLICNKNTLSFKDIKQLITSIKNMNDITKNVNFVKEKLIKENTLND